MPTKTHTPAGSETLTSGLRTMSAAVVSALMVLSGSADAAGLGRMTVLSSLGQPLRAEIELTSVTKEEAGSLTARLAPMASYRQAKIDFNPALHSLQFAVEQRGAGQVIRVTSTQPINDPFVDMLLEVGSPTARLLREYTFLLDPPDTRTAQSAQLSAQPVVAAKSAPQVAADRASATAIPAPVKAAGGMTSQQTQKSDVSQPANQADAKQAGTEYLVRKGDSLGTIAQRVKPEGISLDQMLVALYRANPDAFIDKNMNRLRSGQILGVPSAETAGATGSREARSVIIAQAADFNEYRKKLAGQVAAAAPSQARETGQSATGKVTSRVNDSAGRPDDIKDKLELSKAAATEAQAPSSASAEDRIAQSKALEEANARVRELEKNVSDLQSLLSFKNKELADRQTAANPAGAPVEAPIAAVVTAPVAAAPSDKPAGAASPAPATAAEIAGVTGDAERPVAPVTDPLVAGIPDTAALSTEAVAAATAAGDAAKPAIEPAAVKQPGFMEDPLNHPWFMPLAGLLAIGLGSVGIFSSVRRRKQQQFEDSLLSDSSLKANSLFGSTGGQSVDTNNSVFNSSFTPSASQLDTNEVDPVAEADVYIAYGRDVQAEEILKEALRTQPERNAVRLKLLEIYASRKDPRAFEIVATELFSLTKGTGEDWQQASSLGLEIDSNNPLYAGGKPPANDAEKTASIAAAALPFVGTPGHAAADADNHEENALTFDFEDEKSSEPTTVLGPKVEEPLLGESDNFMQDVPSSRETEVLDSTVDVLKLDGLDDVPTVSTAAPSGAAEKDPAADFTAQLATLNFDLGDAPAGSRAGDHADVKGNQASDDHALEFDFNLDDLVIQRSSPAATNSSELETGISPVNETQFASIDTSRIDTGIDVTQARSAVPMMNFDLAGIDLDLSSPSNKINDAGALSETGSAGSDTVQTGTNPEMATKLDLAAAYREIGDKEGARELLDEVMRAGTAGQIAEAQQMLEKLS